MATLIPPVVIVYTLNGQDKKLSFRDVPVRLWGRAQATWAVTPKTILERLQEFDVNAIAALVWITRINEGDRPTENDIWQMLEDGEFLLTDVFVDEQAEEASEDGDPPTDLG